MTIKDIPPVKLIEHYLHKEEQKARLITIHELATKLLAKQAATATESKAKPPKSGHAVYEHLRPMYRTVHRTKPREMVLRAIRWVNPERMFPIMSWDDKKLDSLSLEEFEAAFVELAKIRREAHVISNRYDQMLNAIKAGQLPYHIPYANINYMSLAEHEDRATRLGAGAEDWGWELDEKAEEFRAKFEGKDWREDRQKQADAKTKEGRPLTLTVDSIDGLWEDGAPPFMRTREGRKGERLMRARRQNVTKFDLNVTITSPDGSTQDMDFNVHAFDQKEAISRVQGSAKRAGGSNVSKVEVTKVTKGDKIRMPTRAKIWAQEFVAVPELERRPGEEIRIPRGNLKGMIRIPAKQPSWMSDAQWKTLQKKQKGQFGPRGKKIELSITPLDFYDTNIEIALRREERWTQRGLAPHRGAASQAAGGHAEEAGVAVAGTPAPRPPKPATPPQTPEEKAEAERVRAKWEADQEERKKKQAEEFTVEGAGHAKATALLRHGNVVKRLEAIDPSLNDWAIIEAPDDFDPATHFTADNIVLEGEDAPKSLAGGQWNRGQTMLLTDKSGQKWVLKVTGLGGKAVENERELLYQAIDRALGLNVTPRVLLATNVDASIWANAKDKTGGDIVSSSRKSAFKDGFEGGQGHINEFINSNPDIKSLNDASDEEFQDTFSTPEKRRTWYSMALLDAISGNMDSWSSNIMIHPERGIFSIDNGLGFGGFSTDKSDNLVMKGRSSFGNAWLPGARGMGEHSQLLNSAFSNAGFDQAEIRTELSDFFDEHFDAAKIQKVTEAMEFGPPGGGWDTLDPVARRKEFVDKMMGQVFDVLQTPGLQVGS